MNRLLLIITLFFSVSLWAQDQETVKGVAILKTVDEVGDVKPGVKLNLRATLAYAINHMPGYEAYTRVNLTGIMDEHKFQRSGFVNDSQIKQIGKATGAQYILIAEVAYFDEQNITVTASIIDIETTRIKESSDPVISPVDPDGMRESCIKIARSLLRMDNIPSSRTTTMRTVPQGYVDLGLPSGTLWKAINEGMFDWDTAMNKFGDKMPSQGQWEELKDYCTWTWTGSGYKVSGSNGNSIVLPAAGIRYCSGDVNGVGSLGNYWSSTPSGSERAWFLGFYSSSVYMNSGNRCYGRSVRLVHNP